VPIMEKLFRVPCTELQLFRLVCKGCQATAEVALNQLGIQPVNCPGCGKELRRPDVEAYLQEFRNALVGLQSNSLFEFQLILNAE
jgi:hypothetical protein